MIHWAIHGLQLLVAIGLASCLHIAVRRAVRAERVLVEFKKDLAELTSELSQSGGSHSQP